jgi:hypothetical protein
LQSVPESRVPWPERTGRLKSAYGTQIHPDNNEDEIQRPRAEDEDDEDSELEMAARSAPDLRPREEQTSSEGTA